MTDQGEDRKIDAFCHIHPRKLLNEYVKLRVPHLLRFVKADVEAGDEYFTDDAYRIKYMDRHGIDVEVLSISQAGGIWQTLNDDEVSKIAAVANEALFDMCKKNEERLIGTSIIPRVYDGFLDEVKRGIEDFGFKGIMIYSNMNGLPLDHESLIPLYELMQRYDLPIFIHPTNWQYYPWIKDYRLQQIFGWPFDTSIAMGRIVFGGIFEQFPKLKIVIHHSGGMIPYFRERILGFYEEAIMHSHVFGAENFSKIQKGSDEINREKVLSHFKKFYVDTVLNGNMEALRLALSFFGTEKMVFATDFPFGPEKGELWTRETIECVKKLEEENNSKGQLFHKNTEKMLNL